VLVGSATVVAASVGGGQTADTTAERGFRAVLRFAATDTGGMFSVPLSRDVVLDVRRTVDAQGRHLGWDLSARDRRLAGSPNFFYECLCGHGPRPHDYFAWHFVSGYYPHQRSLPVYGYPLEVRVRCPDCQVAGTDATEARFVGGHVEISVRRLARSNPRQLRIPGIVRTPRSSHEPAGQAVAVEDVPGDRASIATGVRHRSRPRDATALLRPPPMPGVRRVARASLSRMTWR
jgi:hypothetical protein